MQSLSEFCNNSDIDECLEDSHDCVMEAPCLNTEGSFLCICPESRNDTSGREGEGCFGKCGN